MNRCANDTIKGYIYQFLESYNQILEQPNTVVLEGTIEDIDIEDTNNDIFGIQCKYYEEQTYSISAILPAILELFLNFKTNKSMNKDYKYKLFVHISENKNPTKDEILVAIKTTKNKQNVINFLSKLYVINDQKIISKIDKPKKSQSDKDEIFNYITENRESMSFIYSFDDFWDNFSYVQSVSYDELTQTVKGKIENVLGKDEGDLFYSNGLTRIAELSTKKDVLERTIDCFSFLEDIRNKKQLLFSKWSTVFFEFETCKIKLRKQMKMIMDSNCTKRAFYFSKSFVDSNIDDMPNFINDYLCKYYKKPMLNKKPVFIFENDEHVKKISMKLSSMNIFVNSGKYMNCFSSDCLINDAGAPNGFKCYLVDQLDLSKEIYQKMGINYLFMISNKLFNKYDIEFQTRIILDLKELSQLRYVLYM